MMLSNSLPWQFVRSVRVDSHSYKEPSFIRFGSKVTSNPSVLCKRNVVTPRTKLCLVLAPLEHRALE